MASLVSAIETPGDPDIKTSWRLQSCPCQEKPRRYRPRTPDMRVGRTPKELQCKANATRRRKPPRQPGTRPSCSVGEAGCRNKPVFCTLSQAASFFFSLPYAMRCLLQVLVAPHQRTEKRSAVATAAGDRTGGGGGPRVGHFNSSKGRKSGGGNLSPPSANDRPSL